MMDFHADYWEGRASDPLEYCYDDRDLETDK